MKLSTIYRKAALLQEKRIHAYPCWAIASVCRRSKHMWMVEGNPASEFTKVFSDGSPTGRSTKYQTARWESLDKGVMPHDFDVVALCFAAAIMEGK